jgi:ribose-phosphate pyrophosphokinase
MAYILMALRKTDIADRVAQALHMPLIYPQMVTFADGECQVILENPHQYAGKHIVVIQSTGHPVNDNVIALAFYAQELKHAGASTITAIIPYFGYSRQERSAIEGKPGHGAVIARLLESSGISEMVTIDLHCPTIIDFFSIPVRNLSAQSIIVAHIKKQFPLLQNICLVAPDGGIAPYVQKMAHTLSVAPLLFCKERFGQDQTRAVAVNVNQHGGGITAVVIDDIIATGGTVLNVGNRLFERGYATIVGYFVHPVLAGDAVRRLKGSSFSSIYVSNTLPLSLEAAHAEIIKTFDVSPLIIEYLQGKQYAE